MARAFAILLLCLGAAACGRSAPDTPADDPVIAQDPVIARALHDPLMSDPDLASRNEANAALGFPDSHALPVLRASGEDAQAVREAMRLELLASGPIAELPKVSAGGGGPPLGPMSSAQDLLAAVSAPEGCAARLREDFALAASLPPVALIPPGAMVMQAAGSDAPGCALRIIRYRSAAPPDDLLQYQFTRAVRAGLAAALHEGRVAAQGKDGARLTAHVRPAPHGMNGVTLVYLAPRNRSPAVP